MRERISKTLMGHKVSKETRLKISIKLKGRKRKLFNFCCDCNIGIRIKSKRCKNCHNKYAIKLRYINYKKKIIVPSKRIIRINSLNKKVFYDLYIKKQLPSTEISKILKISVSTVLIKLTQFNIKIRTLSEAKVGIKNPLWKGGYVLTGYDNRFVKSLKINIIKRDNNLCRFCEKNKKELKIDKLNLAIHHIDYNKKLSVKENLISLCSVCHSMTNFNRNLWKDYFQLMLMLDYNYEYREGKIITNIEEDIDNIILIRKLPNKKRYRVYNKISKKIYSYSTTLLKAKSQKRLLLNFI